MPNNNNNNFPNVIHCIMFNTQFTAKVHADLLLNPIPSHKPPNFHQQIYERKTDIILYAMHTPFIGYIVYICSPLVALMVSGLEYFLINGKLQPHLSGVSHFHSQLSAQELLHSSCLLGLSFTSKVTFFF